MQDQPKTRGGWRKGAGRKTAPDARRLTISAKVNAEELAIAQRLGWGNASEGVRHALQYCARVDPGLAVSAGEPAPTVAPSVDKAGSNPV